MINKKHANCLFLYKLWSKYQPKSKLGFTLVELLVALAMSSIVLVALLTFMSGMIQANQRESTSDQTQQEMQMALDYIVNDLKEATYVYGNNCHPNDNTSCPHIENFIPNFSTDDEPVLAFWKAEPIKASAIATIPSCSTFATQALRSECNSLKIKRRAYSLIVYLQTKGANGTWKGKSRLRRYRLPKYANLATLTRSTGFVDPVESQNNFAIWPYDSSGTNLQTAAGGRPTTITIGNTPVLVDYVDNPSNNPTVTPTCPTGYDRSPDTTNYRNFVSYSFFTCIKDYEVGTRSNNLGQSQEVIIYLRGNAIDRNFNLSSGDKGSQLPTLQTQISVGGVVQKSPQ
jgi:prepilin-type N-terminal cleavage/methylation domain-containing protein